MNAKEQRKAAKEFAEYWKNRGNEKSDSQSFWLSLLRDVYGVVEPEKYIRFEKRVKLSNTSFIDGYIDEAKVMIEQKSKGKDLSKAIKQSDGTLLTPFQQAKRYITELPVSEHPKYVVTSNFDEFYIYDMENPKGEPQIVKLENLGKDFYRLNFLIQEKDIKIEREMKISVEAGSIVGELYDLLLDQYKNPDDPETLHSLNIFCVRIVFCLYAEDSGIFDEKNQFYNYLSKYNAEDMRIALIELFKVLNEKEEDRDPYLHSELAKFPYVNGGLFETNNIEIPRITEGIRNVILEKASNNFDWSLISPTIFGAVFESTLNPDTRRKGGMHYTSIENIHKVIDPLFLQELEEEFKNINDTIKRESTKKEKLEALQIKLSNLKFLDPACGSGNFLTETYISLRRLENKIVSLLNEGQMVLGIDGSNYIKVNISQFYGIEINDFAVTVAKTALWIAESQMMKETEEIIHSKIDFLPLKTNAFIHEGNALKINWEDVVPKEDLNYIIGNPPFVGARMMTSEQKSDFLSVFNTNEQENPYNIKNLGNLDFVCGWFKKAADYMKHSLVETAFVSTNSIYQGEQAVVLWKHLIQDLGIKINFAWNFFKWESEASEKAAVYCSIVGFSNVTKKDHIIFNTKFDFKKVKNINGYLMDGPNVFIESRTKPICNVENIGIGNKPIDGGNYLFTYDEMNDFIKKEPLSKQYFKQWYGATEFINNKPRYCLWLGDCSPSEISKMPRCLARVEAVRNFRLDSKSKPTNKIANIPTRFHVENMPKKDYLVIPRVTSSNRKYIPIDFLSSDCFVSDAVQLIPVYDLYYLGVLTSNVHMSWMRAVAGKLKSDYRYSKNIVYNNFPWCLPTDKQKQRIEITAKAILDARSLYPDSSLGELYNDILMPKELRKAHQENDKAVMEAYGFDWRNMSESDCVARLMDMYEDIMIKQARSKAKSKTKKRK